MLPTLRFVWHIRWQFPRSTIPDSECSSESNEAKDERVTRVSVGNLIDPIHNHEDVAFAQTAKYTYYLSSYVPRQSSSLTQPVEARLFRRPKCTATRLRPTFFKLSCPRLLYGLARLKFITSSHSHSLYTLRRFIILINTSLMVHSTFGVLLEIIAVKGTSCVRTDPIRTPRTD